MTKMTGFSMKKVQNIKFSTEMPYRLVPLPEKLCIFHCSIEKLQLLKKITKMTRFSLKSGKYQIFQ